jgi:hypothetical protein
MLTSRGRLGAVRSVPAILAIGSVLLGTESVQAGGAWTVTSLHPEEALQSRAISTTGTQQAGYRSIGDVERAVIWNGSAASWVDLHPGGGTDSQALATMGAQQAGWATGGMFNLKRAGLWSGTAASWVDLHPAGASVSVALATSGAQQAGWAEIAGEERAGIWSGSASSWVDLHPAGAGRSAVNATTGTQQAGWAFIGGVGRAGIWSGTAASWVSLDPAHAGSDWSVVNATTGTQQAGWAFIGLPQHAGIWSGTAMSWVDLHPAGATASEARGTTGMHQAGWAEFAGVKRAGIWSGTAASWEDLSAVLTGSWGETRAEGIWSDGAMIQVVGWGWNNSAARHEALLWSRSIPVSVDLTDLMLSQEGEAIRLSWRVALDGDAGTVRILRAGTSDGDATVIMTRDLSSSGRDDFLDPDVIPGRTYRYWLEIQETGAGPQRFGPWSIVVVNPRSAALLHSGPHPASARSRVQLYLPQPARVEFAVYTAAGRVLRTVAAQAFGAGSHDLVWDHRDAAGESVPAGVYAYRLRAGGAIFSGKFVVVR